MLPNGARIWQKKEGYCMKHKFSKRLLSFLLAVVILLGLVPAVATPKTAAATADEVATQTASYLASLKSQYGSL